MQDNSPKFKIHSKEGTAIVWGEEGEMEKGASKILGYILGLLKNSENAREKSQRINFF